MLRFKPKTDYKKAFEEAVNEIIDKNIEDRTERIRAIDALIDEYVDAIGSAPDPKQLERLADYILREELLDRNPHKVRKTEYPIFTEAQLKRRRNREAPDEAMECVGIDGRDYRTPTRRKRSIKELMFIDKQAKSRNKERRRKYREFTKPGEVKTYFLDNTNKT